jgi:serine/threonine protein phosphatase PrpC
MAFELDIGYSSETGKKEANEDFLAVMLPERGQDGLGVIAAVADGVSVGGLGREAAQTTVTSLVRDYYGTPESWDTTVALDRIISAQNAWLAGQNQRRRPQVGLTTLTALVLRGHSYTLAHVGDTRAYVLREGSLTCLTQDHVVQHPDFSHQLLRCVGGEDRVMVDYSQGDIAVGDCFVLMSDGVHGSLRHKDMLGILETNAAERAAQLLVQAALAAGSMDNVSALVIRVGALAAVRLQDAQRQAKAAAVPALLKVGADWQGMRVAQVLHGEPPVVSYVLELGAARFFMKTVHPQRATDAQERQMLAHEAWLAKRMESTTAADHFVPLAQLADLGEHLALLQPLVPGRSLAQVLKPDGNVQLPSVQQSLLMVQQAAKALGVLHRQGVVHRDIKPSNLLWGEDGLLRVLDLGVATSGHESAAQRDLHAGSPSYMNPEQWGFAVGADDAPAQNANAQSDVYALGVVLYELLTGGKLPYGEVLPYQVGRFRRDPQPPSRVNRQVPKWLDHLVLKAVSRDQSQRFETAEEMLLALERGAARPLTAPVPTPLMQRDPSTLWKLALAVSGLINALLIYWMLFLPTR